MKIAVFHNFMDNIGGAEFVALALARGLDADVYTTNLDPEKIKAMGYGDVLPRIISVGSVPKMAPFRHQLALWKMRRIDANKILNKKTPGQKYDFFIIAGDWAMSAAVKNKPNLWYVHSPLNELWQFKDWIRKVILAPWKRLPYDIFVWFNKRLTKNYAKHVGIWVSNSKNVQDRIRRFYGYNSTVINPAVDISTSHWLPHKDYWLSVNRILTHKRLELQMEAMAKLPNEKLIVVGSYEKGVAQFESYKAYIDRIKPDNVEILHWVDDAGLRKLYSECKGLLATAKDEDFGMSPIEAMACGKPVVAANEGGYKESVIDGKTGILIDDIDSQKLADAITEVSGNLLANPDMYREICITRASEFDITVFIGKILKLIKDQ